MTQQYNRHAVASLDEIIPEIMAAWDKADARYTTFSGHSVGVSSLRLKTFCRAAYKPHGLRCTNCGLYASFFAVETFVRGNQSTPHLNLYGVKDDEEVLFTHDHTVARALGGADNHSNVTVMCFPCNNRKGVEEGKVVHALNKQRRNEQCS